MKRRPKELQKNIKEVVDFYMQSVVNYQNEIREGLEYYLSCMSVSTIDDYLETVRNRTQLKISDEEIKKVFQKFYGDGVFDDYKLDFIKAVIRKAQQ